MAVSLKKFEITDSVIEHNEWRIPSSLRLRPLRDLENEEFLVNHKIDRSYDDSSVRFKLLVADRPLTRKGEDTPAFPMPAAVHEVVKQQGWISDEYEHLWRRDGGGSAALTSHGILSFHLQTPRDGRSFCSLSLVNKDRSHCGGFLVADEQYGLESLLADQPYLMKHTKVPRDFAILPFNILVRHVEETLDHAQKLSRNVQAMEHRLLDGDVSLEDNGDYKLLSQFSLENLRLQRRSSFELELATNLAKYIDDYHHAYLTLWDSGVGGTSYIEDMQEKIEQQKRYSEQVKVDLDIVPRRIKNQSKMIFNFIAQRDNKLNIEIAQSSRKIAEESRRDNLLNIELAKATAQVAEETRQDSAAMKTIAVLTLTFLPGTAVATFFSMNGMFNWNPSPGEAIASPLLWVFFAVTVPVTALVYAFWVFWFRYSQKRHKVRHEEGLQVVEKELKMRVRSATTMTW